MKTIFLSHKVCVYLKKWDAAPCINHIVEALKEPFGNGAAGVFPPHGCFSAGVQGSL